MLSFAVQREYVLPILTRPDQSSAVRSRHVPPVVPRAEQFTVWIDPGNPRQIIPPDAVERLALNSSGYVHRHRERWTNEGDSMTNRVKANEGEHDKGRTHAISGR